MIGFILFTVIAGAIVGGLGRLAIPGPNPMSIGMTILVGIGGSFLGSIVARLLGLGGAGLILSVAGAALIVYLMQRSRRAV